MYVFVHGPCLVPVILKPLKCTYRIYSKHITLCSYVYIVSQPYLTIGSNGSTAQPYIVMGQYVVMPSEEGLFILEQPSLSLIVWSIELLAVIWYLLLSVGLAVPMLLLLKCSRNQIFLSFVVVYIFLGGVLSPMMK